jgi:hypothetical protein
MKQKPRAEETFSSCTCKHTEELNRTRKLNEERNTLREKAGPASTSSGVSGPPPQEIDRDFIFFSSTSEN